MSGSDSRGRARPSLALSLAVLFAAGAALLPLTRVIEPGPWLAGSLGLVALMVGTGFAARCMRFPPLAVGLTCVALWTGAITFLFARGSALWGIIPLPATVRDASLQIDAAMAQVREGAAPLLAGLPLSFFIVATAGLVAIVVDQLVVTARMPLLAALLLIVVYLVPAIAVAQHIELGTFIVFTAGLLLLFGIETATRDVAPSPASTGASIDRARGTGVVGGVGVGAIAIVVAITVAPALPAPAPGGTAIVAIRGNSIDPSLDLGRDLRRPQDTPVLRVRSDAARPPYLRAVTLSRFDGTDWQPDRESGSALDEEFDALEVGPDVPVTEYTATIQVVNYVSPWLPVPYPAVGLDGLEGDWSVMPENRTVLSDSASPQGQDFTVTWAVPRPSTETIRAARAAVDPASPALDLPEDDSTLDAIRERAEQVTSATSSDYDALVALQRWFRGADFDYSLNTPVRAGFDGTGVAAVEEFLEVRSGYCVHFASAFAIMARTLDMPARIVVGYLPGAATTQSVDGQTVHEVSSSQLHSWPEVHFEGIGWVAFEPTSSLGVPTAFTANASGSVDELDPGAAPPGAPPPAPSLSPGQIDQPEAPGAVSLAPEMRPALALSLGVVGAALLLMPTAWRLLRRRRRLVAAQRGDATAAWAEVCDCAVDLGVVAHPSESPRALGRRLVDGAGADHAAMAALVDAIERASYAPPHVGRSAMPLDDAVRSVRRGMLAAASRRSRLAAACAPRSLRGGRAAATQAAG